MRSRGNVMMPVQSMAQPPMQMMPMMNPMAGASMANVFPPGVGSMGGYPGAPQPMQGPSMSVATMGAAGLGPSASVGTMGGFRGPAMSVGAMAMAKARMSGAQLR